MPGTTSTPVRYPSGVTTDLPFQPWGWMGVANPAFYNLSGDDFNYVLASATGPWVATNTGNGTIAATAGDGGLALFTTNSSSPASSDLSSLQRPAACYTPPTLAQRKRMGFVCRLQCSDMTNAQINIGLIQTTVTPFTVTDGIYINKAQGSATLNLISTVGSTPTSTAFPTAAYTLANNTNIDLAWFWDGRSGTLFAYVGYPLVGPGIQSVGGIGNQDAMVQGPVLSVTGLTLTTANLNPTIALQSGTASSKTMTVDFAFWAKER